MIKRILLSIILLLVLTYLIVAITAFNRKPAGQVCYNVEPLIKDTVYAGFIVKKKITVILEKKGINSVGKNIGRIHAKPLEQALSKHPLIDEVECYKMPSDKLYIEVTQRIPILRIISASGKDYYLDSKGTVMLPDVKRVAHRAITAGNVEKPFVMRDLYKFGVFLQKSSFWNAQIEQICVLPGRNIGLVSCVDNHIIYLDKLDDFERRLKRVKTFHKKGLSKVGWNKYSRTSVGFDNQIICTKR